MSYNHLKLICIGLKLTYMGLKVTYMGLKLSLMGLNRLCPYEVKVRRKSKITDFDETWLD